MEIFSSAVLSFPPQVLWPAVLSLCAGRFWTSLKFRIFEAACPRWGNLLSGLLLTWPDLGRSCDAAASVASIICGLLSWRGPEGKRISGPRFDSASSTAWCCRRNWVLLALYYEHQLEKCNSDIRLRDSFLFPFKSVQEYFLTFYAYTNKISKWLNL